MKPVAGVGFFLAILFLWRLSYPYSCLAWIFPLLVLAAVSAGQYEMVMHARKYRAWYFFRPESWIHRLLLRKSWAVVSSVFFALPVTVALCAFVAIGSAVDWAFLIVNAVLIIVLNNLAHRQTAKHVTNGLSEIIAKRITVAVIFWVMLVPYIVVSYFFIDLPAFVDAASLENTVAAASSEIASLCPLSNWLLKLMQEVQAAAWYGLVQVSTSTGGSYISLLIWTGFFLNAALVFLAMGRGCVEMAALMSRWGQSK